MIHAINSHNLHSTARETVSRFAVRGSAAAAVPAGEPCAVIAADIAAAFGLPAVPGLIEVLPAADPAPAAPAVVSRAAVLPRQDVRKALLTAERYSGRSPSGFQILEFGESIALLSVDTDGIIQQQLPAVSAPDSAADPLRLAIDAKKAAALLSKLKADCVDIVGSWDPAAAVAQLEIRADGGAFILPAQIVDDADPENRPAQRLADWQRKPFAPGYALTLSAAELLDSLQRVEFATDPDSTRYALAGVNLAFCRGSDHDSFRIEFCATDSRRMSYQETGAGLQLLADDDFTVAAAVLPAAAVAQLLEILPRIPADSAVYLAYFDSAAAGRAEDNAPAIADFVLESPAAFSIRMPAVAGRFPRYHEVIPRQTHFTAACNRAQLLQRIETAAAVCSKESRGMDFVFDCSAEQPALSLKAESAEFGRSCVTVRCECSGLPEFCFNDPQRPEILLTLDPKYIVDFLRHSGAESVSLSITDPDSAVLFRDDSAGCYVVMPLSKNP